MLKSLLVIALFMSALLNVAFASSDEIITSKASEHDCQNSVEQLVGTLILARESERSYEKGTDAFGAGPALSRLYKGYHRIQNCMSKEQKTEFFWVMLWHSDFDGEMKSYLEFVKKEVGSVFLSKAVRYKNALEKYKRSKGRLHKIKAVILDLEDKDS